MNSRVTVQTVLSLEYFQHHRVIAGKKALDNFVEYAATVETRDIADHLVPGTMIATLASDFQNHEAELREWIQELYTAGVSAICIKIGRFIHFIPEEVVEMADQLPIPLIISPPEGSVTGFIDAIMNAIYESKSINPNAFRSGLDFFRQCLNYPKMTNREKELFDIEAENNNYFLTKFQIIVYDHTGYNEKWRRTTYFAVLTELRGYDSSAFGAITEEYTVFFFHPSESDQSKASKIKEYYPSVFDRCNNLLQSYERSLYISRIISGAAPISEVFQDIVACIDIDQKMTDFSADSPVTYRRGNLLRLLNHMLQRPDLCREYVERELYDPIIDEAPLRQKEIRQLLRVYFRFGGKVKDIASYTHTHSNTVQYRIQYIENVYNCNLKDHKTQWNLQLALMLHAVLK